MVKAVLERRAVRKFMTAPVSENDVKQLVAAFQASPCGMHQTDVMQGIVAQDASLR